MYEVRTIHIGDDDQVTAQREDGQLWVTVLSPELPEGARDKDGAWHRYNTAEAVELFIDPVHFPVLRAAMDVVDARNAGDESALKPPGNI